MLGSAFVTQSQRDDFAKQIISLLEHGSLSIVHCPWGHELVIETDAFLLKLIDVDDGQQTSLQRHDIKDEVQYVVGGEGGVFIKHDDGFAEMIHLGEHVRVRPGTVHRTIGPVTLIEVTTLHDDDIIRLEDDYGRANIGERGLIND
jgi:mannose-6-phosphate isomerase-like protein (cupin superfamily)